MLFSGKKFSEIILEQKPTPIDDIIRSKEEDLKPAEFMGKAIGGKFIGYNEFGEPEYELPEIKVTPKSNKTKINLTFADNGEVLDVKFN